MKRFFDVAFTTLFVLVVGLLLANLFLGDAVEPQEVNTAPAQSQSIDPPPITDVGLHGLGHCESTNNPTLVHLDVNDRYSHGEYQFQQPTWDETVRAMGWVEWEGVPPSQVPSHIQDQVAAYRWNEMGDDGAWYHCRHKAIEAMQVNQPPAPTPEEQGFTG